MKLAIKTIEKIKAKGYLFTYMKGSKCFIRKNNGNLLEPGRMQYFDSPTQALKSIS